VAAILAQQSAGALPDLRQHRPDIPDAVVRVLLRGAARDPEGRYPSADEYLLALERAIRTWRGSPWRWLGAILGRSGM